MKKIIVSLLLLLPISLVAQEIKIAHVNTQEVYSVMPEVSAYMDEMAKLKEQYNSRMKELEDEYARKYADYTAKADSLTDNIKTFLMQEIMGIEDRIRNFVPMAENSMAEQQQKLMAPIQEKLEKAIMSVADENGYTYVMDSQAFLYRGNNAIDATEKVKAKLGIK